MTLAEIEYVITFTLFLTMFKFSIGGGENNLNRCSVVFSETSLTLKALCCLVIICHHYALRVEGGPLNTLLRIGGGTYALSVFLLLSAYGIARSEVSRPTRPRQYARKRLWKLLCPYLLVTFVTLAAYWLAGGKGDAAELQAARVNPAFVEIGQHRATLADMVGYVVGLKSLDGAMWFVGVTLWSYVAFLVAKVFVSQVLGKTVEGGRGPVLAVYVLLVLCFALLTYWLRFPAHYYRNLWALALGMWLALYERDILAKPFCWRLAAFVLVNAGVFCWLKLTQSGDWVYLAFANAGFLSVLACNAMFRRWRLKPGSSVAFLSAVSYLIYLVHGKVLVLEWWFVGYDSAILVVVASVLLACLFSRIVKYVLR